MNKMPITVSAACAVIIGGGTACTSDDNSIICRDGERVVYEAKAPYLQATEDAPGQWRITNNAKSPPEFVTVYGRCTYVKRR